MSIHALFLWTTETLGNSEISKLPFNKNLAIKFLIIPYQFYNHLNSHTILTYNLI